MRQTFRAASSPAPTPMPACCSPGRTGAFRSLRQPIYKGGLLLCRSPCSHATPRPLRCSPAGEYELWVNSPHCRKRLSPAESGSRQGGFNGSPAVSKSIYSCPKNQTWFFLKVRRWILRLFCWTRCCLLYRPCWSASCDAPGSTPTLCAALLSSCSLRK